MELIADFDLEHAARTPGRGARAATGLQLPTDGVLTGRPRSMRAMPAPRLRPALDLLGPGADRPTRTTVVDLGCGSGALFPALRARFATARLDRRRQLPRDAGERARAVDPDVELVEADAAVWRPGSTVDLIVANASLQLIAGHERLIPELLGCCRCLAVQVPDNFAAPSHRLVRETMAQAPWSDHLAGVRLGDRILSAEAYAALLRGAGRELDLWRTTYYHQLGRPDAGAGLAAGHNAPAGPGCSRRCRKPEPRWRSRPRWASASPQPIRPMADGTVLFPFSRLFFVATALLAR